MERFLVADDKFDIQQNFRRALKCQEQLSTAKEAVKEAKGSRVWIVALIILVFAISSKFFLGAAAALAAHYLYRVIRAWYAVSRSEEALEESERWFSSKGLKLEGRVLYFNEDSLLERPLDPFNDEQYR
ncbi:hypothetical protein DN062_11725 [Nitrincola tibetensis]|jgi:hypothetical protein|uniref:Uncharacterized protein n=1 Tax=Nitrincola tibetensis TaxID=2219697 RepID=A0A364NKQ3_9GAMM|nr:hypothetical protein [Nitrincola tibetensis]RAU17663.1 hypothetical protein DN062_11725 [Nitrincola tibetensis]